jgi:S-layer protein (TIGR01567 family)
MVQFRYAWLIDESTAKEIQGSDDYGVFQVTQATSTGIKMDNKNTVSLSRNTDTTLMGNLVFSIADNSVLRFYPQVTYKDPGKYEVRGSVADASNPTSNTNWTALNFAGFYYDMKNNISTETLSISQSLSSLQSSRIINENKLVYTTKPQPSQFKMNDKENVTVDGDANYSVVGWQAEKWIAVNGIGNKLAKLAFEMDKEDKKTLTTGETWSLGSGYELTINAVDARATPRQVWFTLKKDGAIIDEGIGQGAASDKASKQNAVYYKTKTILGEQDSLLFTVYVDSIFSGATSDMVQFRYAWLIDESTAKEIQGSDDYGVFQVTQATSTGISMDNKNTVSLSRNTETTLMGNLVFKIADNAILRFYPMVAFVIGGEGTNITTGGTTPRVTTTGNRSTTLTATSTPFVTGTTAKPATTETTPATTTAKATPKEPGFEAVFAIAGLLAVAFLVLRQRK